MIFEGKVCSIDGRRDECGLEPRCCPASPVEFAEDVGGDWLAMTPETFAAWMGSYEPRENIP